MTPWTVACQTPLSMDFRAKNTGVGCHSLFHWESWVPNYCELMKRHARARVTHNSMEPFSGTHAPPL